MTQTVGMTREDWAELVAGIQATESCDHLTATRRAVARYPKSHRRFLLGVNEDRPAAQAAILESFDRDLQQARCAANPGSGDPIAVWDGLVERYVKSCGSRTKAVSMAVRKHPEAHREMLRAYNAQHGRPCGV